MKQTFQLENIKGQEKDRISRTFNHSNCSPWGIGPESRWTCQPARVPFDVIAHGVVKERSEHTFIDTIETVDSHYNF